MRKFIMAVVVMVSTLFAVPAFADNIQNNLNMDGLNDSQKAEMVKKLADLKDSQAGGVSVKDLNEYADLGTKYGIALASVAKELGKSIDDIMNTNIGKIALVLIVWKVLGAQLLGVASGIAWYMVTIPLWIYFYHRNTRGARRIDEDWYENGKLKSRVYQKENEADFGGTKIVMLFVFIAICVSGWVMIF